MMMYREYRACFMLELSGLLASLIWMNLRSARRLFFISSVPAVWQSVGSNGCRWSSDGIRYGNRNFECDDRGLPVFVD